MKHFKSKAVPILEQGPVTTRQVADALQINVNLAAASMKNLYDAGLLDRELINPKSALKRWRWRLAGDCVGAA